MAKETKVQKSAQPSAAKVPAKHHYVRTFFAGVFGSLGLTLVVISILVLWLGRLVTDTDTYVNTVSSVVQEKPVQDLVVNRAADALLDNKDVPIDGLAEKLLTPEERASKTNAQLAETIRPLIESDIRVIVSSSSFEALWTNTNRDFHTKLIAGLNNGGDIEYDLTPIVDGAVSELSKTRFSELQDKIEVPADKAKIVIKSDQIEPVKKIYGIFKLARIVLIVLAVVFIGLAVLLSVHHSKTLRRVLILTGVFFGILAVLLSSTRLLNNLNIDEMEKSAAIAVIDILFSDLRIASIIIAVLSIGVAITTKVVSKLRSK